MIVNYLAWLIFGCVCGWLMSQILPAQRPNQTKSDVILGALSAFGTGTIMQVLIHYPLKEFNLSLLIISILGAVVALATHRTFVRT